MAILSNGVYLNLFSYFNGTVHMFHLDKNSQEDHVGEQYTVGNKVVARVLHVDYEAKKIGLSLLPHIIKYTVVPFESLEIGDIKSAKITRIDQGLGLSLKLEDSVAGYCHISRVSDEKIAGLEKVFELDEDVQCRIVGFSYVDGCVNVSMKQSHLTEKYFKVEDLQIGRIVKGKITSVNAGGVAVSLSQTVHVFCPKSHLGDSVKDSSSFTVGGQFIGRVLSITDSKITVTHKKSLVKTELPVWKTWEEIQAGDIAMGFILTAKEWGCGVGFFGDIKGRVAREELSTSYIADPSTAFKPGQVMKCKVLSVIPEKKQLTLSFKMNAEVVDTETQRKNLRELIGKKVEVTVQKSTEAGIVVEGPEKAYVGWIPVAHLADHSSLTGAVLKHFKVGAKIEAFVLSMCMKKGLDLNLTLKPSYLSAPKKLPKTFGELAIGQEYIGAIDNYFQGGVFLTGLDTIKGLVNSKVRFHRTQSPNLTRTWQLKSLSKKLITQDKPLPIAYCS